jgi:hypothetical protein
MVADPATGRFQSGSNLMRGRLRLGRGGDEVCARGDVHGRHMQRVRELTRATCDQGRDQARLGRRLRLTSLSRAERCVGGHYLLPFGAKTRRVAALRAGRSG